MMIVLEKAFICSGVISFSVPSCDVNIKLDTNSLVPEVLVRDEPLKVIILSVPETITCLLEPLRDGVIGPAPGAEAALKPNP